MKLLPAVEDRDKVEIMRTKKFISIIIIVTLICSLVACDARKDEGDSDSPSSSDSQNPGGSIDTPSQGNTTSPSDTPSQSNDPSPGNTASPDVTPPPSESTSPSESPSPDDIPSTGGGGESGLSGTPEEVLSMIIEGLNDAAVEMPMSIPPMAVTAETSQYTIGLSEADFERYVAAAAHSMAAIGTFAHQIIIIQGVDDNAAGQIKKLVSGADGYDSQKWICVFPQKSIAVDAGPYVLLVASYSEVADTAIEILKNAAGSIGEVITFWEGA